MRERARAVDSRRVQGWARCGERRDASLRVAQGFHQRRAGCWTPNRVKHLAGYGVARSKEESERVAVAVARPREREKVAPQTATLNQNQSLESVVLGKRHTP